MLYAMLVYHEEHRIEALTPAEDAGLMESLISLHEDINRRSRLGPAARLDFTPSAVTVRASEPSTVFDGPFAETKEQLLGFYLIDCADMDAAVAEARKLCAVNPTAVYEIRPVRFFLPGSSLAED
jgi:hypothetical protein